MQSIIAVPRKAAAQQNLDQTKVSSARKTQWLRVKKHYLVKT